MVEFVVTEKLWAAPLKPAAIPDGLTAPNVRFVFFPFETVAISVNAVAPLPIRLKTVTVEFASERVTAAFADPDSMARSAITDVADTSEAFTCGPYLFSSPICRNIWSYATNFLHTFVGQPCKRKLQRNPIKANNNRVAATIPSVCGTCEHASTL